MKLQRGHPRRPDAARSARPCEHSLRSGHSHLSAAPCRQEHLGSSAHVAQGKAQDFLLSLLTPGGARRRRKVLIEEDSADRSPSRDSNRRQSRADVYEDDDEEPRSPSRGRSTSPHSQASPTPRRASQEDSHRALEPASAVLQGVKASSPIPTEAVTVNLERIQPAPVPAHRSTPTAARSNGRQTNDNQQVRARSPTPRRARTPVGSLGAAATAASRGPAGTAAPRVTRSDAGSLSSLEDALSISDTPMRRLTSTEDIAPVRRLDQTEERAPVNGSYRRAPVPARRRRSGSDDAAGGAGARASSVPSDDDDVEVPRWGLGIFGGGGISKRESTSVSRPPAAPQPPAQDAEQRPPAPTRTRTPLARAAAAVADVVSHAAQAARTAIVSATTAAPVKEAETKRDSSPKERSPSPAVQRRSSSTVPGLQRRRLYQADQLMPGEDPNKYDYPNGPRWSLVRAKPWACGTLEIVRWEGRRMLRVWLPPGYDKASVAMKGGLPSVYLHDAQSVFDPDLSLSGNTWRVAETAAQLIMNGQLPPFAIVGIDHPGLARAYEYTPYKPGTGPGGFREDAAQWPGGGVWKYLERLVNEVVPWATERYCLSESPELRVMGGSSFGGIATLCAAMKYPHVWGGSLVESPSLWIAEEKLLKDLEQHEGSLSSRVFVGMGGREYSGVRSASLAAKHPQADRVVEGYAQRLADVLKKKGVSEAGSLLVEVQPEATHNELAWADRFPRALTHLATHWWTHALRNKKDCLYFSIPRRLRPNCYGLLLVNRARSEALRDCATLRLHYGYNINWELQQESRDFQPVPWTCKDVLEEDWWCIRLDVPESAYEMHFALSGAPSVTSGGVSTKGTEEEERQWDNNNGANFYVPLAPALDPINYSAVEEPCDEGEECEASDLSESDLQQRPKSEAVKRAERAMSVDPQPVAHRNASRTYFTLPENLIAGAPARVFFNRKRSWAFADKPNCKIHYGWNGWSDKVLENGAARADFKPTTLWRDEKTDWWAADIEVPLDAVEMNFAFTDGADVWDANGGFNYSMAVTKVETAPERPRAVDSVQATPHGEGTMHVIELKKRPVTDPGYSKQGRWADEKIVRVWTPPGWDKDKAPPGGWPVLYLADGQNMFEDELAHQGVSWRAGYQSSDLISSGRLPPYVVVGIDSAGPMRSLNYLPYAPGSGKGGFRGDAERWPGGGVASYMKRVTEEIMPLIQNEFSVASDPELVSFGGGSFGGVCALYVAMHYPHLFGSVLAESPSLWIAEGRFLEDMESHRGRLAARVFLGCGTREYSATRDHARPDVDKLLLNYCTEAARILDEKGCRPGQGRLRFHVEPDAGHHESAWAWRFSGAMEFLLSHLWEHTLPQAQESRSETK